MFVQRRFQDRKPNRNIFVIFRCAIFEKVKKKKNVAQTHKKLSNASSNYVSVEIDLLIDENIKSFLKLFVSSRKIRTFLNFLSQSESNKMVSILSKAFVLTTKERSYFFGQSNIIIYYSC